MERIHVLVVDDHPIVRQGIRSLLSNYPEFAEVGAVEGGTAVFDYFLTHQPDITLLDIRLQGESGLEVLGKIRQLRPDAKVLMLTSFDDTEYVLGALKAGAQGYILKNVSDEMLVNAILAAHRGERVLSPQVTEQVVQHLIGESPRPKPTFFDAEERQLLRLLVKGTSNADIAAELFMSDTTVKRKLRKIFEKLDVQTRAEAAAEAVRRHLV
jgi:DNA-binding NarL/FixJ family response regulator